MNLTPRQIEKLKNRLLLVKEKPDLAVLTEIEKLTDTLEELSKTDAGRLKEIMEEAQGLIENAKQSLEQMTEKSDEMVNSNKVELEDSLTQIKEILETYRRQTEQETKARVSLALEKIDKFIENIKIPEDGEDGQPGKDADPEEVADLVLTKLKLPDYKEFVLQGEQIVKEINDLPVNDDDYKIDAKHIKNLPKSETKIMGGGKSMVGQVYVHNLSSSLDGVTKTFSLPAFSSILAVFSQSFPGPAFLQGTDFTVDGAAMTITFTDTIAADVQLAAGQQILILYTTLL
jgi:ElaB/YqjD/DUF883 family membrane-anchored ribosome-binding protein